MGGELKFPLRVLERALAAGPSSYLLGDRFTVADLNLAVVVSWARVVGVELAPCTDAWLKRCMERPMSPANFQEPDTRTLASMSNPASFAERYGTIGFVDG